MEVKDMVEPLHSITATPSAAERVKLGPTDILISPLGIGTWSWGDTLFWQYGQSHTENDVQQAFAAGMQAGINFYDTAEVYGSHRSETILGGCLQAAGQPVVTATKFMPFPWRLGKGSLLKALRESLDRLGLASVDLYQVHQPIPPVQPEVWMEAMADAAEAGLVRAVGVSNYSAAWTRRSYAALVRRGLPLASNQVEYSLLQRAPERNGVMQACRDTGATLIAYSPIAKGILSGKYSPEHLPGGVRKLQYNARYLARVRPLIALLHETGDRRGKNPAQVALNWVICKGAVPIPGAKNVRQAEENAGALGWRLTDAEVAALDDMSERVTAKN
jgi:aryl-alcohol dehydrogenase-like predicted oxidoreductase